MRFSPTLLDEIRARLPVSQVVSRHVRLKRTGREYTGLSPFKQEKTPSFTVNDEKGFYHCFATGEHGDIFTFLIKVEGISFPESVEKLAAEAGVELPKDTPEMQRNADRYLRLQEVMEASCNFFEQEFKGPRGTGADDYLSKRGLDDKARVHFRIGYAPNGRDLLKNHLTNLGFTLEEIVTSGMCVGGRDIAVPYDRFRDRLMFPIADLKGKVIAFGGRALSSQQKAKYLNSPETPLFHKGRLLYNIAKARQSAYDRQAVIAVEGYMDTIACAQAGFENVVAPLGTALTPEQLQLMWRLSKEPILCFDGDEAGKKAAWRAIDTVLPELHPGFSLRFAFLPDGQDPDDLIKSQGKKAFGDVISKASPLVDVLWQRELKLAPTDTPERRAAFEARLHEQINRINDPAVKTHYDKEVRQRLWELWRERGTSKSAAGSAQRSTPNGSYKAWRKDRTRPSELVERFQHQMASSMETWRKGAMATGAKEQILPREALVLEALINHSWLLEDYSEEVSELTFVQTELSGLRDAILQVQISLSGQNGLDREAFRVHLKEIGFGDALERVGAAHVGIDRWVRALDQSRTLIEESWHQMLELYRRQMALSIQLDGAKQAFDEDGSEENLGKVRDLNARYLDNENMFARSGDVSGAENFDAFLAAQLEARGLK
ncbi:MAG: DNA primase [bacterium]|nr:DNA primase [bacterium]